MANGSKPVATQDAYMQLSCNYVRDTQGKHNTTPHRTKPEKKPHANPNENNANHNKERGYENETGRNNAETKGRRAKRRGR